MARGGKRTDPDGSLRAVKGGRGRRVSSEEDEACQGDGAGGGDRRLTL